MKNLFDNDDSFENSDEMSMTPFIFPDNESNEQYRLPEQLPNVLPLFPLKNNVQFPQTTIPILVSSSTSKNLLSYLEKAEDKHVLIVAQTSNVENPGYDDLLHVGILGEVVRVMEVQDDMNSIVVLGKERIILNKLVQKEPHLVGEYSRSKEVVPDEGDLEFRALISSLREVVLKIMIHRNDLPKPLIKSIANIDNPISLLNFACSNFPNDLEEKVALLLINDIKVRAFTLLNNLNTLLQL